MKKKLFQLIFLFGCLISAFHLNAQNDQPLIERKDVQAFMKHMVSKHHYDAAQLKKYLSEAKIQPTILSTIAKPAEKLPWHRYQAIFLSPKRIQEGVSFWQRHAKTLAKAEKEFGVPAEIIVAIIGVETFYGKQQGQYNVLDALVTLGFDYPPRSKFFLSELEEFLLLAREEKWDPKTIKGSYAGAMGTPQFIASSYRRYAVDFKHKGKRDLLNNVDDAIGSVANYFKLSGWKKGELVAITAKASGDKFKPMIASKANPKPEYSLREMTQSGVTIGEHPLKNQSQKLKFALIALEGKTGPEYWLGAENFYVITRYNHSDHYAMAVYNLSQKIKTAYHLSKKNN